MLETLDRDLIPSNSIGLNRRGGYHPPFLYILKIGRLIIAPTKHYEIFISHTIFLSHEMICDC